jgi:adenylate kinase
MPDDRFPTLLLFGAPGCGKGTQGHAIGMIPRFFHCACGEVFRSLDTRTELGQQFVNYSSRGELVPDEFTVKLWKAQIDNQVQSYKFKPDIDFLILDGIPRNIDQSKIMERHIDVVQVFHLSCPDRAELHRRLRKRALKDNRLDDANEEVIRKRLTTYENESKPMLDYYTADRVTEIDASQPPAKVTYDILEKILSLPAWIETSHEVW